MSEPILRLDSRRARRTFPADLEPWKEPQMKFRHFAAWFSVVALLGMGATLIRAQPPQRPREGPVRPDRARLRAEVIRLRTEVEMLRFDYDLARDGLIEDVKTEKGFKMAGEMMGAIQFSINEAGAKPPGEPPRQETEQARKKAAQEAKKADEEEKREAAELAAAIAERKKELARRFASLAEKQLDLEDAERNYRDTFR
jgi:hypothetical protein